MKDELIQDLTNMEDAMSRVADRSDIWQDRLIYAICKAVYDLLKWAIRRDRHETQK